MHRVRARLLPVMATAMVVGAVMVGLWSLTRGLPDRFPQTASMSTAPAPPSSDQQIAYGQWLATFDHVFVQSRWYPAVSGSVVMTDDTLIIRTTLGISVPLAASTVRGCYD